MKSSLIRVWVVWSCIDISDIVMSAITITTFITDIMLFIIYSDVRNTLVYVSRGKDTVDQMSPYLQQVGQCCTHNLVLVTKSIKSSNFVGDVKCVKLVKCKLFEIFKRLEPSIGPSGIRTRRLQVLDLFRKLS